jgi:hypothetical protein
MKEFWKNHKATIIILGYIIAAAFCIYFFFMPLLARIKAKSDDIQGMIIDSQLRKTSLDKVSVMKNDFEELQEKSEALDVVLSKGDQVNFIKSLESLAQDTKNKISLKIDQSEPVKGVAKGGNDSKPTSSNSKKTEKTIKESLAYTSFVSMRINIEGDYGSLFINKLENGQYYVNILSIDSKKKVAAEEDAVTEGSSYGDIFSPDNLSMGERPETKKENKIINTTLDVVVYLKK